MSKARLLSIVASNAVLVGTGSLLWSFYGQGLGIFYFTVYVLSVSIVSIFLWYKTMQSGRAKQVLPQPQLGVVRVLVGLMVAFFWVLASLNNVLHEDASFTFNDGSFGFLHFMLGYMIAGVYVSVYVLSQYYQLRRDNTILCPSPTPFGFPVVGYKVERRGGELVLVNKGLYVVLIMLLSLSGVGFMTAFAMDPSLGVFISSMAVCLTFVFALHMQQLRYIQFRADLVRLDHTNLKFAFAQTLVDTISRCQHISRQALIARKLSKDTSDISSEEVAISYQTLFFVLFSMNVERAVRVEAKDYSYFHKKPNDEYLLEAATMDKDSFQRRRLMTGTTPRSPRSPFHSSFQDPDFPPSNKSLYADWEDMCEGMSEEEQQDMEAALWCRPKEMARLGKPKLVFNHGMENARDVVQGEVGDCWLLSAMSVLALRPGMCGSFFFGLNRKVFITTAY